MNDTVQKLLQPVSAEKPSGPDLSDGELYGELEQLLKGKPEVEIGPLKKPAEPPDWRALRDKSADFLRQSKHLRVVIILTCSWLRTSGLPGFRDGLQLIGGILEEFWDSLHPVLDPADNNDPTHRLNILSALAAPRGASPALTGWLTITDYLYSAPFCQPKNAPAFSFEQLQTAKGAPGIESGAPALATLLSAMRGAGEQVSAQHQVVLEALESIRKIDSYLTNKLSAGKSMSFDELQKTLEQMRVALEPYLAGAAGEAALPEDGVQGGETAGDGPAAIRVTGPIRSREDVVQALERICQYYDQIEPGSPVPFLLRRAQKMCGMNFVQAVQELSLVSDLGSLRPSMGSALDDLAPPSQTS